MSGSTRDRRKVHRKQIFFSVRRALPIRLLFPVPETFPMGPTVKILGTELRGRGQRSYRCIGEKRLDLRINCAGRNNDEKRPKVSARALY
jgi:hypothetical protein